jgi:hypothetical protein
MAVVLLASALIIIQEARIRRLKVSQRHLAAKYGELSTNYVALLAVSDSRAADILTLSNENSVVRGLRIQLALSKESAKELAALSAENEAFKKQRADDLAGYLTTEQPAFAGFASPKSAFQTLRWAVANADYTNWIAALAPRFREEETANPKSLEDFQRSSERSAQFKGMQVLATKSIGSDKVELKVRLDMESTVAVLIFPMLAVGNEWRLGDEIRNYTQEWDQPGRIDSAQVR